MTSVSIFAEQREKFTQKDRELVKELIDMHADMCMALDLTQGVCPDENPEKNSLMQYERTLAATVERLKELSPYLK